MDIRHLRYFVTIADCASINHASERLHVAQSSLSVHLANLEGDLGVKLMERNRSGVRLTPAGQLFYEQAHSLLRQYQLMRESVRGLGETPRGRVSLGMPSTTSAMIANELYARIANEFPEISIYITDAGAGSVYEWLLDGRVDLAVMFSVPDTTELDVTHLHEEDFWLVSRAGTVPSGETVDFRTIFDIPLVTSSRSTTWRKALDEIAERFGKSINPTIETESVSVLRAIVLSGRASAVLPRTYVEQEINQPELICQPLVNPNLRGVLSLVHLSAARLNPAQHAVKKILIDIMKRSDGVAPLRAAPPIPITRSIPTIEVPPRNARKRRP